MKTFIEETIEKLGLPPSREGEILQHSINSVRNPMPSKVKPLDYYVNRDGWQRRYVLSIDGDSVHYAYYSLEDYHFGNDGRRNEGYWEYRGNGYCTKAHIRNWSQK